MLMLMLKEKTRRGEENITPNVPNLKGRHHALPVASCQLPTHIDFTLPE